MVIFNSFRFAKKAVSRFEPFIQQSVRELIQKIAGYKDEDRVLAIDRVWDAYATDMITQYSFGFTYKHMQSEDFLKTFKNAFLAVSEFGHIALQWPWITPVCLLWNLCETVHVANCLSRL